MTQVEARDLKPGQRIAAGYLPLKGEANIIFVKPYPIHAITRVFVVYEYLDEELGLQPTPDDFLPDTLIPVVASPDVCTTCGNPKTYVFACPHIHVVAPACCQDAEASAGHPEILHTSGCPNRCAVPTLCTTNYGITDNYQCALTKDHPADHWIPSDYTRRTAVPHEFEPGDRFLLPAGNGKVVRTGTILSWQNPINPRSEGSWYIEIDPIPETENAPAVEGWKSWYRSADLLPADASQADIDAYVAERQARWFKPGPITRALHSLHECANPYTCTD